MSIESTCSVIMWHPFYMGGDHCDLLEGSIERIYGMGPLFVSRRDLAGENHRGLEAAATTAYCRSDGKVERQSPTFPAPRDSPPPREREADPPAPPSAAERRLPLVGYPYPQREHHQNFTSDW